MIDLDPIPLTSDMWTTRAANPTALVNPITDAFLQRRAVGKSHAVHDFLFTYYSFSPQKLKQWVPSLEEGLILSPDYEEKYPWFNDYWFLVNDNVLSLNRERIHDQTRHLAQFISTLCNNILQRPPRFGCFGLHEWAMVYKLTPEKLRHKHRLRLSAAELATFIETQNICCSHYDAYRFFTPEARPLNVLNPIIETRLEMEQGGCVHANMDLYKWSSKLWPWIGSDFIAKTFLLALECRELDMRASPYDLSEEGYVPICIETEEGRKQYQKEQLLLTERSTPLRQELRAFCERFISLNGHI
jgi:hypothetical protein